MVNIFNQLPFFNSNYLEISSNIEYHLPQAMEYALHRKFHLLWYLIFKKCLLLLAIAFVSFSYLD